MMDKKTEKAIEGFIPMLENTSAQKYYRANPYTKTDGVDFQGTVTEELFFEKFYVETNRSAENINYILYTLKNSPEATIILRGYSGCGKTSFLHDLLYHHIDKFTVIDCEKGIDNQDNDPILTKITFTLVEKINDDIINNQAQILKTMKEIFYSNYKNSMAIGRYIDGNMLTYRFFEDFFVNDTFNDIIFRINRGEETARIDMANCVLTHMKRLHGMQLLFVFLAWDISTNIFMKTGKISNVFCVDNLDNVDSEKIKVFLKYYTQFWINIIHAILDLDLTKWKVRNYELVQNYSFILVLRETTYAKLTEHFNGSEKGMVEEIPVDNIYSESNVFENRSKFLLDNKDHIPQQLLNEVLDIDLIFENKYIRKNILSLYNNDNNTAMRTLCVIRSRTVERFRDIREIRKNHLEDVRGEYGIVLFLFINYFKSKRYFSDYLMLYNFKRPTENQNYKYSATRLLLSYLSNCKESVSMYQIFQYFDEIIAPGDIASILYQVYQLRFSEWRHLITFADAPPDDDKWVGVQTNLYENIHENNGDRYAKVQITTAGKMYLRTIVPHFEFFSVRIENYVPLFCSCVDNINPYRQKYISIIDRVFNTVKDCNKRICDTVNEICSIRNWSKADYLNSKLVYRSPSSGKKQFHGERVIFSHIGYINAFRKFIISREDVPQEIRAVYNKIIAQSIKRYLILYNSPECLKSGANQIVKEILWNQTMKVIANNNNFSLPIEMELDD